MLIGFAPSVPDWLKSRNQLRAVSGTWSRLGSRANPLSQSAGVDSARPVFGPVPKPYTVFPVVQRCQFSDLDPTHDTRAVDAYEYRGVETALEIPHGRAYKMRFRCGMKFYIIASRREPEHCLLGNNFYTCTRADEKLPPGLLNLISLRRDNRRWGHEFVRIR